jgi:hypothetical protein
VIRGLTTNKCPGSSKGLFWCRSSQPSFYPEIMPRSQKTNAASWLEGRFASGCLWQPEGSLLRMPRYRVISEASLNSFLAGVFLRTVLNWATASRSSSRVQLFFSAFERNRSWSSTSNGAERLRCGYVAQSHSLLSKHRSQAEAPTS